MKKIILSGIFFISIIFFAAFVFPAVHFPTSTTCDISNTAFIPGEEIVYQTSYNWGFIWLDAGEVIFNSEESILNEKKCYHISGIGGTFPSYDWIYKVRDRFEVWVDSSSLKPLRYIRDIKEGGRYFYNECFFNFQKQKGYCITKNKKKVSVDTVSISSCAFDPLSMIYYSRNIDFSKYKMNDTIPIELFLDNKIYNLYLRYLGKDKLTMDNGTVFNCIKFSPKLVEGTIFKGGEGMTVWASDDKNRIPLYVEAPILVGTIKAKIVKWKGLRNKLESKIN